jgi:hypothetical protein
VNDLPPPTLSLWRSQQQGSGSNTEDGGLVEIPVTSLVSEPDRAPGAKVHLLLQERLQSFTEGQSC